MAEAEPALDENSSSEEEEPDSEHDQVNPVSEEQPSQKSSAEGSNQDRFFNETKYVVLNFMSLLPPDLYSNHLSASPESAISDLSVGDKQYHPLGNHYKAQHQLTKSKSFDISPQRRIPKLKHLSHLKALQEFESPASEDNLNYRYRQYLHNLDQQSISIPDYSPDISNTPETFDYSSKSQSQNIPSFKSVSPGSVSPRKTVHGLARWYSDISSSGDFSYASDADDEGEDLSNASSTFSLRSGRVRDGFLDLRKPSPRLSTVTSQSEADLDEVDGLFSHMSTVEEEETKNDTNGTDGNNIETQSTDQRNEESNPTHTKTPSPRQTAHSFKQHSKDSFSSRSHMHPHSLGHDHLAYRSHPVAGCSQDLDDVDHGVSSDMRGADRSKLKLDIPSQVVQLDDILLSLQTDLNSGISDLESEFEEALRSSSNASGRRHPNMPTPLTPQTEAARILARIGDEVRDQYGNQITAAVNEVMLHQLKELTYEQFKEISKTVIDQNLPGWRQVALLMVFGQKMVWKALERGQKQFGSLVDFSAQLVADVAADFIIREGGWGAVMNFDPSQSSDSQSSAVGDVSPSIIDYFNSHEVTQVESEDFNNEGPEVERFSSGTNVDTGQKSRYQNYTEKIDDNNEKTETNGESFRQESLEFSDSGHDASSENVVVMNTHSEIVADMDNADGVFNENTNENANQVISDQNRFLSVSGRGLVPSLGFEYRPDMSISMSEIPSAGMVYSDTDGVKDVFDYEEGTELMNSEKQLSTETEKAEKEEVESQNNSQQNHIDGANLSDSNASDSEAGSKTIGNLEQNKSDNVRRSEINQSSSIEDEKIDIAQTSVAALNTNTHIDNHSIVDNQTTHEDDQNIAVLLGNTENDNPNTVGFQSNIETDNQSGKTSSDNISLTNTSQDEGVSGEDNYWYTDYRRLGYGAVGLSLGVLALAIGIRQIK